MPSDFSSVYLQLDDLLTDLPVELAKALGEEGGGMLVEEVRATSAFEDQSGATRAGFVAFSTYQGVEYGGSLDDALSEVEALNPGQGAIVEQGSASQDEIVLTVTSPTKYEEFLEGSRAGANMHLGPAMDKLAGRLTGVVAGAAGRVLG